MESISEVLFPPLPPIAMLMIALADVCDWRSTLQWGGWGGFIFSTVIASAADCAYVRLLM
jgi:hypothetical protein